jgi:Mn2+/Fe2+ NRAMP family transporter
MSVMMLLASSRATMGDHAISGWLRRVGWLTTVLMAAMVVAMAVTS